jgi:hypothetical protein
MEVKIALNPAEFVAQLQNQKPPKAGAGYFFSIRIFCFYTKLASNKNFFYIE